MSASPTLPTRWTTRQRLKNNLIFLGIRGLWAIVSVSPRILQTSVCRILASLAYRLAKREVQLSRQHLSMAFPELEPKNIDSLTQEMFKHFGESVAELMNLDESVANCLSAPENKAAFELLRKSLSEEAWRNRRLRAHRQLGIDGTGLQRQGFPVSSVAKPTYDPRLTALVDEFRGRNGMKTLWRGQAEVFKAILKVFQDRETFGILIDQDTKVPGDFVPFFGELAFTPTAAATLHRRTGAPVLVGCHHRSPEGPRIKLTRVEPQTAIDDPNFDRDFTAQLTQHLEQAIREEPAQWVWLHRRWKTRPVASGRI